MWERGSMQFRLLGPVDVLTDGERVVVPGRRRAALLTALALHPGAVVSADRLIDAAWGASPPAGASATLQSHISYLRRLSGAGTSIRWSASGYVLDAGADGTDLLVAERLIRAGTQTGDPGGGARLLEQAIGLWRGPALADLATLPWFDVHASRLDALLLRARRALVDRYLASGRPSLAIAELQECLRQSALDERLHEQLMLALYRSGRQADALAHYHRLRALFDRELGIVPGRALRELHASILRHDPGLEASTGPGGAASPARSSVVGTRAPMPAPAQLPAAVPQLVGREPQLRQLDELIAPAAPGAPTGPRCGVVVISGMAGVGKSTLATWWAHRVADRFADGQLWVDLRGHDPGRSPMHPQTAARTLLIALGVAAPLVPADLDSRTGLLRTVLARQQVLIVLDDARDAAQVRALLPGGSASLVLVTSRDDLRPLIAAGGAHSVHLPLPTHDECRDLLAHRLGEDRLAAQPEAVTDIIDRCARLPLALAVVAASAASLPRFPLAAIADDLRGDRAGSPLDALDGGDPATGVRAVLARSYHGLPPATARMFRLLSLHPGPEISVGSAASLAGRSRQQTRAGLAELARAHLLIHDRPGRWSFHALLRAYAAERTHALDGRAERAAAVRRMLDHYLHAAQTASRTVYGDLNILELPPAADGVCTEDLAGERDARAWLVAEQQVLVAMVESAHEHGEHARAWRLATVLTTDLRYRWYDWNALVAVHRLALESAETGGDTSGRAHAHYGLGLGLSSLGRPDDGVRHLQTSHDLFAALGDAAGQGRASHALGFSAHRAGAPEAAMRRYEEALSAFRAAADRGSVAVTLNNISGLHAEAGRPRQALDLARQALSLIRGCGSRQREAAVWDTLGHAHHLLMEHPAALAAYARAVDLYSQVGNELYGAETLVRAGETHREAGNEAEARRTWQQALAILERLDHPDVAAVRDRLGPPRRGP